jgi:hypothetical protein
LVLLLFFTAADAGLLQAGYPPFGLADVSFVALSSYLILIGLYYSAVSVAEDVALRKSIKNLAIKELKLLDSIGTAQMMQEIEEKVMRTTKTNADLLAKQSGVDPSLTDDEIKDYMEKITEEVKKQN